MGLGGAPTPRKGWECVGVQRERLDRFVPFSFILCIFVVLHSLDCLLCCGKGGLVLFLVEKIGESGGGNMGSFQDKQFHWDSFLLESFGVGNSL